MCIYSKIDDKKEESKYYGYKIPYICLFWLTLRISKENNLEMLIIFCNKFFVPSFPKVLLTLMYATKFRIHVTNQTLPVFSYFQKEEKVSRRFCFTVLCHMWAKLKTMNT